MAKHTFLKKILLALFFICSLSSQIYAHEDVIFPLCKQTNITQRKQNASPISFMITMPKSGTHLLMKFWHLLRGIEPVWADHYNPKTKKRCYPWYHFYMDWNWIQRILDNPRYQVVINIRDPRDVCVSIVDHLLNSSSSWLSVEGKAWFSQLSFDEQLFYVIEKDGCSLSPHIYLEQVSLLIKDPRAIVCRFEDLVGPEGGGSKERQIKQVESLLDAFSISLSDEKINLLTDSLFGIHVTDEYSATYRKGQIGSWKECFTDEHKKAFKEQMGKYLIELGYEDDYNW